MKESFIFYGSFFKAIKLIANEHDRLKVYEAICHYSLEGQPIDYDDLDDMGKMALLLIEPQLKANKIRYENGSKGGAPKGNQNAKKDLKTTETNQEKQPKLTEENNLNQPKKQPKTTEKQPNKNVNVNVNVNDNVNISPLDDLSCDIKEAVCDWLEYKKEKRQEYKPRGMTSLITEIQNNIKQYGANSVIEVINYSMANNWQGIAWDILKKPSSPENKAKKFVNTRDNLPYKINTIINKNEEI